MTRAASRAIMDMMARPALKARFPDFYGRIEPLEVLIWRKSRTILVARLVTFVTWLIAIHDAVAPALLSVDWAPLPSLAASPGECIAASRGAVASGANGSVRYQGCAIGLARGRSMEGEMGVSFTFRYVLTPAEL